MPSFWLVYIGGWLMWECGVKVVPWKFGGRYAGAE